MAARRLGGAALSEIILVNRRPVEGSLDPTLVDVIHHHASGPTHLVAFFYEGRPYQASVVQRGREYHVVLDGHSFTVSFERARFGGSATASDERTVRAPMDCRVIAVYKGAGVPVRRGEPIARIESMKLESNLVAGADGTLAGVHVQVGDSLREGQVVASLEGRR